MIQDESVFQGGITYRPTDQPLIDSIRLKLETRGEATISLVRSRVQRVEPLEPVLLFERASHLAAIAVVQPSRSTTGMFGAKMREQVWLDIQADELREGVSIEEIEEYDTHVGNRSAHRPSQELWNALVRRILYLRSDLSEPIIRLLKLRGDFIFRQGDERAGPFLMQRDQLATSLQIAGFDRSPVLGRIQPLSAMMPDIGAITDALGQSTREEAAIFADARVFPGLEQVNANMSATRFQDDHTRLDVVVVHNQAFERQHGADLLYVNHRFQSLVLVQYKMYERAEQDWEFRPDGQTNEEIGRMQRFRDACDLDPAANVPLSDFRLSVDPCYFKLMKREEVAINSDDLIQGDYFPLWLWEGMFLDPELCYGPRGGRVLRRSDAERKLCRTAFVGLVKNGWIGTRMLDTGRVIDLISERAAQGASVMLAVQTQVRDDAGGAQSADDAPADRPSDS